MISERAASLSSVGTLESVRQIRLFESQDEQLLLVNQFEVLLAELYAHLPLKAYQLGVNSLQRVRAIQAKAARYQGDAKFMADLLCLSAGLRDYHTQITAPEPWSGLSVCLPFRIREYFDASGAAHYLVGDKETPEDLGGNFGRGVEVTHWNGEPFSRVLESVGQTTSGANPGARRRRALEMVTRRPLRHCLPPPEDCVTLRYLDSKGAKDIRIPWRVEQSDSLQFSSECLSSRQVVSPSGTFGYLRIAHFMVGDVNGFVKDVTRSIQTLPETGLIIDLRGNMGGSIPASERLLQLFSEGPIEPQPFHFRRTDMTRRLSESHDMWVRWAPSLRSGGDTGELFSHGFPLTSIEDANCLGRVYPGPVVLLCDAMSYSATELFIAGFKDHRLGMIIGADMRTGAGGSTAYSQQRLARALVRGPDGPFKPLPRGVAMHVALLRSTRVGSSRGLPLEGLGVEVDLHHPYTRDDIMDEDVDLLARAGRVLAARL